MTEQEKSSLLKDPDGLLTYEYIANNIGTCIDDINFLTANMIAVDNSGQFTASAARYLAAIDANLYADAIKKLVSATIEKDREHRYLMGLMQSIWGPDCHEHADELSATDDNFRRIHKRLYPTSTI